MEIGKLRIGRLYATTMGVGVIDKIGKQILVYIKAPVPRGQCELQPAQIIREIGALEAQKEGL